MKITLAYAPLEGAVFTQILDVETGTSIQEVLIISGISQKYPEIDLNHCRTGVYSQFKSHDFVLKEGDRLEIYRPLDIAQRKFAKDRLKDA